MYLSNFEILQKL